MILMRVIVIVIVRALNIKTFLGPEIASSRQASAISGPKKVEMFRALKMAQAMDLPTSKSLRIIGYHTASIGNFMYMSPKCTKKKQVSIAQWYSAGVGGSEIVTRRWLKQ